MKAKAVFSGWLVIALAFYVAHLFFPHPYLLRAFYTFLVLAAVYLIFRLVIEKAVTRRIKDSRTKYTFRKTVSILYIAVFLVFLVRIWVENVQTLLVAYGLIGAALAVSLQDVLKNFAGGVIIFVTNNYRVGDRVEISSKFGDVIDIGIFYTTLLEVGEWVGGEQPTGRLTLIPNSYVISSEVNNYTRDHGFLWDEISLPLTYDSDLEEALGIIMEVVRKETGANTERAIEDIGRLEEKYYLPKRVVEPAVYLTFNDNWINLHVRYVAEVRERRLLGTRISREILERIKEAPRVEIASESMEVSITEASRGFESGDS